jgi:hypothetical protein
LLIRNLIQTSSLIIMNYKIDLLMNLLNKYKDPYMVKAILKNQYKIDIDIKSLMKRMKKCI